MDCNMYSKFELGKLRREKFENHLKNCPYCQESKKIDDSILCESEKIKSHIEAPYLWQRISEDLINEKEKEKKNLFSRIMFLSLPAKLAASFVFLVILGAYLLLFNSPKSSNLLNGIEYEKVVKAEKAYMTAILELEKSVSPKMQKINIELFLKYKDRLQIIDEQIRICKEDLKFNSVNTHMRRYLLDALKDKKDTLIAMNR